MRVQVVLAVAFGGVPTVRLPRQDDADKQVQNQKSDDEFVRLLLQFGLLVMATVLILHQFGVDARVDGDAEDAVGSVDQLGAFKQELLEPERVGLGLSGSRLPHFQRAVELVQVVVR